ncbi:MAG TPA: hypothetical protein VJ917_10235 [Saprospiraceae bacterium]|nr:hypothetical protein [Saprospiraceae bacterium]
MYFRSALFLMAFGLILSCNSNESSSQSESKVEPTEKVQPKGQTLPSLPLERMKRLWDETTQLDYIFLNLPISMNMDNQEAIRSSLSHFAPDGVTLKTNCKQHEGTMLFAVEGEIIEECQFFYQDGCKYFVWLENGKKTYANAMTPSGLEFMEKMFSGDILNNAREPINRN